VPSDYWKLFRPASDPEYSWIAILAGYPVVAIYYWCADQTIVQKVLAAKDLKEGQYGAMFLAALKIIMPLIFIFPGIMCFVLFKDKAQPDNAYITLVTQLMPHGLLGLCIAALIAALIDTVSSGLNSFSTVFTLDVIGQFREMDENKNRLMGRWLTWIAAALAVGVGPFVFPFRQRFF
jgi:SSS family solute:Na+ symporter